MGGAMTAGLAAREIDRAHGGRDARGAYCPNCGERLTGRFCHECGQGAHVHRTVGHVLEELVHGILHVDSKGWRTLPLLVFNPGRLTREYVHGRRARYIAPFAVFLFAFFLMFLTFSLGGSVLGGSAFEAGNQARVETRREELREAGTALAKARTPRARRAAAAAVGKARADLASAETAVATGSNPIKEEMKTSAETIKINVGSGSKGLEEKVRNALRNPDFTLYKIQQKAYKLSFLLVPMSLPILWLMFAARRGVTLYDHAVFVLYSLSFMSLFVIFQVALLNVGGSVGQLPTVLGVVIPPLHMFAQLKGAYRLSWRGAGWRAVILTMASVFVLGIYFGLMLLLGMID